MVQISRIDGLRPLSRGLGQGKLKVFQGTICPKSQGWWKGGGRGGGQRTQGASHGLERKGHVLERVLGRLVGVFGVWKLEKIWFRVQGLEIGVAGLGFRVWG